jgi:hypothetical protein
MSDKDSQVEDIIEDTELQDETLENVEGENLEEASSGVAKEVDGQAAADADAAEIKKSAPAQAKAPTTKAGMLNAMYLKMSKMKKHDLAAAYGKMHEGQEEEIEGEDLVEDNFEGDLNALVESEATLSDGFKGKAAIIFEAALKSKVSDEVTRLEENYQTELEEETTRIQSDLVEKVDGYLNYVVENWMEENKLAVESGLRTEIAEGFMKSLHQVFTEHYVEVPESKVDLVDDLAAKVDKLEEDVNTSEAKNIELTEEVAKLTRDQIIRESSNGLSETQTEKLKSLVEDVTFEDADNFENKVNVIKETYFKDAAKATTPMQETLSENVEGEGDKEEVSISPRMDAYLAALKK